MLKITVDNILTKHELQVRQPVVFVTSGCSDVVKLEGTPKGVPDADCSHALRILLTACHPTGSFLELGIGSIGCRQASPRLNLGSLRH